MTNQYYHDPIPYRTQPPTRGPSPPTSRARSSSRHQHYSPPPARAQSNSRYSPENTRDRHYSPPRNPVTRSPPPQRYSPSNERVISTFPYLSLFLRYDERKLVKGLTFASLASWGNLTSQICSI